MPPYVWSERLRHVAYIILTAIAELHPSRPVSVRLAGAVADALQIQEQVNLSVEDVLKRERDRRQMCETRIAVLEEKLEAAVMFSTALGEQLNELKRPLLHSPQRSLDSKRGKGASKAMFSWKGRPQISTDADFNSSTPKRKRLPTSDDHPKRRMSSSSPESFQNENIDKLQPEDILVYRGMPSNLPNMTDEEFGTPKKPVELSNKRVRVHIALPATPPQKPPPSLPTLRDVEVNLRQQRAERRARDNYKPLPCAKCKLRKRSVMLRQHGYIKEDVFERWAQKPGNCLEYMHQDETEEEGECQFSFTFRETETQSP